MKHVRPPAPDETRAEIARRRLAQLTASFDASPADDVGDPVPPSRPKVEVPHVRALATVAVAACVLLAWWLLSGRPETSDPAAPLAFSGSASPSRGVPGSASPAAATAGPELVVDVVGKVRRPGIVTVPKGSRVYEAIEAAGGMKGRVDTSALNMARVLTDGEQLLVGLEPVEVPGAAPTGGATGVVRRRGRRSTSTPRRSSSSTRCPASAP